LHESGGQRIFSDYQFNVFLFLQGSPCTPENRGFSYQVRLVLLKIAIFRTRFASMTINGYFLKPTICKTSCHCLLSIVTLRCRQFMIKLKSTRNCCVLSNSSLSTACFPELTDFFSRYCQYFGNEFLIPKTSKSVLSGKKLYSAYHIGDTKWIVKLNSKSTNICRMKPNCIRIGTLESPKPKRLNTPSK